MKALGSEVWGAQGGLLSVAELAVLMNAASRSTSSRFLEIGHYYGLSTCALTHALEVRGEVWSLLSIDAHVPDAWVESPAPVAAFESNRDRYFNDPRLIALFERSETLQTLDADFVFYDGDHGAEQLRFARLVMATQRVKTFLFDDRDFPVPAQCSDELRWAGWHDRSPELRRLPGDKANPSTMTLGWFERP